MKMRSRKRSGLSCALPLAAAAVLLTGCQSTPSVDAAVLRQQTFEHELEQSTAAIRAGDLDDARGHVDHAAANASSPREHEKAESLSRLIAGAQALMDGDAAAARTEWSLIDDPVLRGEVRAKARRVGFDVPATPESPPLHPGPPPAAVATIESEDTE